ncbi:MAG: hypothetical protein BJG00_000430 [Limnothrix sp. CACIAM 69d]|nr:MAG: hypothetical protein BJG00_000430 [Limnothrix sp. CACIAM 69d]
MGLPTLTRAIALTLFTPGNTQGSRELGEETPPLRLIGWENEIIRVSGNLTTSPQPLAPHDLATVESRLPTNGKAPIS